MLEIKKAKEDEFQAVRAFYHTLIDQMRGAEYKPGWEKEVYPADGYLLDSLRGGALYLGLWKGEIAAAMIVNHERNEGYLNVKWTVDAAQDEVTVIHALGVLPAYSGKSFAKAMVSHAIALARDSGQKALRLDVLAGNQPAERLYAGIGFQYRETMAMYYEDTGWTDFLLYEYPL